MFIALALTHAAAGCRGTTETRDASLDGADVAPAADAAEDASSPDVFVPTVPVETADEAALAVLSDWRALPVFGTRQYVQFASQDRDTGDPPPLPILANGNRDMNNFVCRSADAQAQQPVIPFVFDLASCPENYVRGFVVARAEGSGQLARLWFTAFSQSHGHPLTTELIRVYVDDDPMPLLEAPLSSLMDGTAGEMFRPPFGAGTPSYLAWYYPVVFAHKLVISIDRLTRANHYYYQADVSLDASPVARRAAAQRLPTRDAAIRLLSATDTGPVAGTVALLAETAFTLAPGASAPLADFAGPATIHALRFRVPATMVQSLDAVRLTVRWDDAPATSIDASLAELFASALDPVSGASLAMAGSNASGDVSFALRLPMPFASRAVFSLNSHAGTEVTVRAAIDGERVVPTAPWGHLATVSSETVSGTGATGHAIANVTARGRLVGLCAMLQGHGETTDPFTADVLNFLEGDERIVLDGTHTLPGTGTEDYFDSAFYFGDGPPATPFAQHWGIVRSPTQTPPTGRSTACRWHVLAGAIDFHASLAADLEVGPGDPSLLERYRTIAFLYR